jgi:hypothetical protein
MNYTMVGIYLVDESIRFQNRFSNGLFSFFGNGPIGKRQLGCGLNALYDTIGKFAGSRNGIVRPVIIWYYHCTSCQFSRLGVTK